MRYAFVSGMFIGEPNNSGHEGKRRSREQCTAAVRCSFLGRRVVMWNLFNITWLSNQLQPNCSACNRDRVNGITNQLQLGKFCNLKRDGNQIRVSLTIQINSAIHEVTWPNWKIATDGGFEKD